MIKNKKGLSAIVTTLLVILLVLVAVGIVWGVVNNVIKSGAAGIDIGAKCFGIEVAAKSITSCDVDSCLVVIERTGSSSEEIVGAKVVIKDSVTSETTVTDSPNDLTPLATRTVDASIIGTTNPDTVEVTVYFEDDSGNEQLCSTPSVSTPEFP